MCACLKYARHRLGTLVILVAAFCPAIAQAVELMDGKLQLHGFVSQGIVFTSNNNFFGKTDDKVGTDFRELGVNFSLRPHPDIQVAAQLLSLKAGESNDGDVRIDYALLDWTAFSGEWGRGGVRLGRVKNPFGFYNKTRDVAFTRPSIILPQSIYFDRTRNLALSSDGVEFYVERYSEQGNWYLNLVSGWPQASDRSTETAFLGRNQSGHFNSDLTHLLQGIYETADGRYRFGLTSVWLESEYDSTPVSGLDGGRVDFEPLIFSAQYNAEKWSLTGEYAFRHSSFDHFSALPRNSFTGLSYYLQGIYRIQPKTELLLRYDVLYTDRDDKYGRAFEERSGRPAFSRYAKDWTLGLKYSVNPNFMLRAEYHRVNGTAWLTPMDNPDPAQQEKRWDMIMLLGSFHF